MGVPIRQMLTVARYLMRQKLTGRTKFPLIVELEPLFACNLACAGCGKIQHPHEIMKRRMSVEDAAKIIISAGMVNPETQARLQDLANKTRNGKKPAPLQAAQ